MINHLLDYLKPAISIITVFVSLGIGFGSLSARLNYIEKELSLMRADIKTLQICIMERKI